MQVIDKAMPVFPRVFLFCDHCAMPTPLNAHPTNPPLLVACLCADWCGTCREYAPRFEQLRAAFPSVQFVWIDVEDESELVDPIEVENFPTLLIATPDRVQFFGTVMPHLETLQRLVETQLPAGAPAQPQEPMVDALAKRLWGRVA
jgi:thiol-disulfide isomerase/thioredoxin